MAVQVGTTEDQGLYNKPSAAVHPGALAAGTLTQYNTFLSQFLRISGYIWERKEVAYNRLFCDDGKKVFVRVGDSTYVKYLHITIVFKEWNIQREIWHFYLRRRRQYFASKPLHPISHLHSVKTRKAVPISSPLRERKNSQITLTFRNLASHI